MRQLTFDGHITFARAKTHPNGTRYVMFAQTERNPRRVVLIKRTPGGGFEQVWGIEQGAPPFSSHPGDGDFCFLPQGGVYIVLPLSLKAMGDKTALFEIEIPNASPPFADGASYTINITEDLVARDQVKGLAAGVQRAELLGKQAVDRAREDGATNERTLRKVGEEIKKSMADVAWQKSADRIYAELNDPNAPLTNVIRQQVEAALKARGK